MRTYLQQRWPDEPFSGREAFLWVHRMKSTFVLRLFHSLRKSAFLNNCNKVLLQHRNFWQKGQGHGVEHFRKRVKKIENFEDYCKVVKISKYFGCLHQIILNVEKLIFTPITLTSQPYLINPCALKLIRFNILIDLVFIITFFFSQ